MTSIFEQRAASALKEANDARASLEAAERAQAFWEVLVGHIERGERGGALFHLDTNRDYVSSLSSSGDPIARDLEALRQDAHSYVSSTANSLGRTFPDEARGAGLVIDSTSRHPRYTFQNGFVQVEFDEKRLLATLKCRDGDEKQYGIDLDVVVNALKSEISRLFARDFNPEPFLSRLFTAYAAVLRADKLPEGTEVPIRRVTHRLSKNSNRFAMDEFNVDLAQAMQTGHSTVEGRQLHLNHTRNTRQGMLLHGLEQGGYVGFISFKREERV